MNTRARKFIDCKLNHCSKLTFREDAKIKDDLDFLFYCCIVGNVVNFNTGCPINGTNY